MGQGRGNAISRRKAEHRSAGQNHGVNDIYEIFRR
jgi:hypothetical protein